MTDSSQRPVLIVEDEPALLSALEALLGILGRPVVTAESGETALKESESISPCLILLDLNLHGIGGIETAEAIRARGQTPVAPILFLSGEPEGEERVRAFGERSGGHVEFLMKPIAPPVLLARVSELLESC